MVAESWFRSLWKPPRKHEVGVEKAVIGVLAFEVASLMSKLVHLWHSLSEKQVVCLREEIKDSIGIRKLMSEDDEFVVGLICAEVVENLERVAKSVARLGKKCSEPGLKNFEHFFGDLMKIGSDPYGWEFSWKKMERKVKKMERFTSVNANLYQEMEMLVELEQTLRRLKGSDSDRDQVIQFEKNIVWKRHQVKSLRMTSLWNRTYDYAIRLLARSVFTIFRRIKQVFGIQQAVDARYVKDSGVIDSDFIHHSQSVSSLLQSADNPSDSGLTRFSSGPFGRFTGKSGPLSKNSKKNYFHSGPLVSSTASSGPISMRNKDLKYYSGPLGTAKSGPISRTEKSNYRLQTGHENKMHSKPNRLTKVGPFKGCIMTGNSSPIANCYLNLDGTKDSDSELLTCGNMLSPTRSILSFLSSGTTLMKAPPETLGAAALALHYANVIIVIEKLVASPHLIGHDAREDLYNMLPKSVRASLRARLKPYSKNLASSDYDTILAAEWREAITGILDWLAPLAHNMIRWQSERSFEQQSLVSKTHVLLVQTLYYANQEKTEATITELLVGLNYICRYDKDTDQKALEECANAEYMI